MRAPLPKVCNVVERRIFTPGVMTVHITLWERRFIFDPLLSTRVIDNVRQLDPHGVRTLGH